MTRLRFGRLKVRLSNLRTLYHLSNMMVVALCFWADFCQWYWCTAQRGWNNKEGGLPQINNLIIETWTQLRIQMGQWSKTHIKTDFGMDKAKQSPSLIVNVWTLYKNWFCTRKPTCEWPQPILPGRVKYPPRIVPKAFLSVYPKNLIQVQHANGYLTKYWCRFMYIFEPVCILQTKTKYCV